MVRPAVIAFLAGMSAFLPSLRADPAAQPAAPPAAQPAAPPAPAPAAQVVVPVFRIDGPVTESPAGETIPLFSPPGVSLKDLAEHMRKAAADPAVKAVVLVTENGGAGPAQVEELRQALGEIRAAGKAVYAHADNAGMGEYVLLSAASRLSVTPTADLWVNGVRSETPYLRGLLDKLGVQPDYLTCGAYKSAAEMFTRTGPSKEADEMTNWLLDGLYASFVEQIAAGRRMTPEQVRERLDAGLYSAERAKEAGLVDAVEHRQDFEAVLRETLGAGVRFEKKYGQPAGRQMDLSSPLAAFKIWGELLAGAKEKKPSGPSVAIVYVEGPIIPGGGQSSPFGIAGAAMSSDVRRALDQAAEDDTVKAVVLRVNSPGGSAVASEIILDATRRVKARKPFAVSMGDVAGSGGYYVAMGADTIFADSTTITGSIGVVAGKFVTTGLWDKVGVNWKDYRRGRNAGLLSTSEPFTDEQRARLQGWMDEVYATFKGHVVAARGDRLKKPIDEIAGGRVYTGRQALDLGLVDRIGTLDDAVRHVAARAMLQDYAVRVVPEPKDLIALLVEGLTGGGESDDDARHVFTGAAPRLRLPAGPSLTDLALPHLQHLDPQRVTAVRNALLRLDLLQNEGVLLTMPEIVIVD
jgi:protease-4